MNNAELEAQIASRLRDAYTSGPIAPFAPDLDGDINAAYRIQSHNTEHAQKVQGRRIVGRKIGLTSVAVQKQLGVNQPDYGVLFEDMAIENGAKTDVASLLQPKIEAEIAFGFAVDVDDSTLELSDLAAKIEWVAPALEIVDSRIADWRIGIVETIADNASSGRFVIGQKTNFNSEIDLVSCQMNMLENGQSVSRGSGLACLGNPLLATFWLVKKLIEVGHPIRAGELILSGALGPMVNVRNGGTYGASVDGLGEVSVTFGS
ncbi:2-keto-4-pentenoate hydratase [Paraburkholderia sp. BL18I3N2]|uniref:2-keto-4-pentenoate hydratase n=1 Tax=Paraburkholderia sp. BL18I3N2 TaxID=1938799 RepID=UPI000D084AE2|nr:fumarylacetoacetate hydrolase family protein [Paraburkholderia sp. BL18I3N2]PRX27315.1 2-keto-4-pentenoate hydratase [Paraburkholderia sp. BL18I3N2]